MMTCTGARAPLRCATLWWVANILVARSLVAPPAGTRGTERLRDELESFGRRKLQCTVESVHYGHNSPSEANAYEQWARKIGSAIRDASRLPQTLFSPVSRCTLTSIAQ